MFFFKKKEKIPEVQPYLETKKETSFPILPSTSNNIKQEINENLIKTTINQDKEDKSFQKNQEYKETIQIPSPISQINNEIKEIKPIQKTDTQPQPSTLLTEKFVPQTTNLSVQQFTQQQIIQKDSSVFVKIEKFEQTKKIFQEIKENILEIENLIKKINEYSKNEEDEIKKINSDLKIIKNKLSDMNYLFNKTIV
ncbi:MAG: hypothetical protein QXG18_00455 [Candidatus Pacearchaeota archaeon]